MEQEPKYPVGVQSFENIRRSGSVYVDKTDLIYKLTHRYEQIVKLGVNFSSETRSIGEWKRGE
jgi:hypothetical protein